MLVLGIQGLQKSVCHVLCLSLVFRHCRQVCVMICACPWYPGIADKCVSCFVLVLGIQTLQTSVCDVLCLSLVSRRCRQVCDVLCLSLVSRHCKERTSVCGVLCLSLSRHCKERTSVCDVLQKAEPAGQNDAAGASSHSEREQEHNGGVLEAPLHRQQRVR